jgi:hypothetical protein
MKCPGCSAEIPDGSKFCTNCGRKLDSKPRKWETLVPYSPGEKDLFDFFSYAKLSGSGQNDYQGMTAVTDKGVYLIKKEGTFRPKFTLMGSFPFKDFSDISVKRSALHSDTITINLKDGSLLEIAPDFGIMAPASNLATGEAVYRRLKSAAGL